MLLIHSGVTVLELSLIYTALGGLVFTVILWRLRE